jgi:hypothetical protein
MNTSRENGCAAALNYNAKQMTQTMRISILPTGQFMILLNALIFRFAHLDRTLEVKGFLTE